MTFEDWYDKHFGTDDEQQSPVPEPDPSRLDYSPTGDPVEQGVGTVLQSVRDAPGWLVKQARLAHNRDAASAPAPLYLNGGGLPALMLPRLAAPTDLNREQDIMQSVIRPIRKVWDFIGEDEQSEREKWIANATPEELQQYHQNQIDTQRLNSYIGNKVDQLKSIPSNLWDWFTRPSPQTYIRQGGPPQAGGGAQSNIDRQLFEYQPPVEQLKTKYLTPNFDDDYPMMASGVTNRPVTAGISDAYPPEQEYEPPPVDSYSSSPGPSASPSELPGPPFIEPPGHLTTALRHYAESMVPKSMDDLAQRVVGTGETYASAWKDPLKTALSIAVPRARDIVNAEPGSQEQWDKVAALGLDALGAARMIRGQGMYDPYRGSRPIFRPQVIIPEAKDMVASASTGPRYWPRVPPSSDEYLTAFRNAVANKDDYGAVNVLRNATRTKARLPFTPDDMQNLSYPVSKELLQHIMGGINGDIMDILGTGSPPPPLLRPPDVFEDIKNWVPPKFESLD